MPHFLAYSTGRGGPVVMCSLADQEFCDSNPTLAKCEFLWAKEMNLQGSTQPRCELVPCEDQGKLNVKGWLNR